MSAQQWHRVQESCDCEACSDTKALAREAASLRQQLEQAQKSAEERLTAWDTENEKRHDAEERASHAEAQLAGLQRMLDEHFAYVTSRTTNVPWPDDDPRVIKLHGLMEGRDELQKRLAELQRRRSLGDQAHAEKE